MSLLLDALRRAAAAKQGPDGDRYTVPRRGEGGPEPAARAPAAAGGTGPGEPAPAAAGEASFELEPREDAGLHAPVEQEPDRAAGDVLAGGGEAAAARALLHGGRGRGGERVRAGLAIGFSVVVLAAAFAGGAWYYYEAVHTDVTRELASFQPRSTPPHGAGTAGQAATTPPGGPSAAGGSAGTAATGAGAAPADAAAGTASGETGATEPASSASAATGEASTATASAEDPSTGSPSAATGTTEGASPDTAATESDSTQTASTETASTETASTETASTAGASTGSASAGRTPVQARPVSPAEPTRRARPLVRASSGRPLMEALQDGYRALQAGDLAAAAGAYRRALRLAPENRDALLGAAAVAQRRGDAAEARALYQRVLGDHPRDPYARAGLASLDGARDPRRSESELKMLLREQPEAASLHFALGNVYAAEARWAEAGEAYREAVRAAPGDAAYAYNLAVALDHLGQRDAARRYYEQALALADGRTTGVPVRAAERRLRQLR